MATTNKKPLTGQEIIDLNRKHVFFSWSVQKDVKPIPVESGKGIFFWDKDGKKYMDFSSQLMNLNIGYQHPYVIAAIQEQATKLTAAHPAFATEPKAVLGKMLADVAPGNLNKVFFALGGAEANENAIKFARSYTKKSKILSRYISYHGATYGSISLTGDYRRPPVEPGIPGVVHVLDPYCYRCEFGHTLQTCHRECIKHIEQVIQFENPDTVAALIMEGITGSNGILIPPDDYWPRLREITKKYGILLISDEVMSGFGRTGEWFAVDNWGVVPDIISFAKGVTSGYMPLGGVIVSDTIAEYFEDKYLYQGLTYMGHPMCCAAGVATIQVYKDEDLISRSKSMGKVLGSGLEAIKSKHPSVGDVRYIGLFSVLELVKDRTSKEPMDLGTMNAIRSQLIADGLSTYLGRNMLYVVPPLVITQQELEAGLGIIDKALAIADKAVQ
jgi:taurine---2-oxoglutarate transaminase